MVIGSIYEFCKGGNELIMDQINGIVRRIDDLGRVVIPKEVRHSLGVIENDQLEISVDDNNHQIIVKKVPAQGFTLICNKCGSHEVKLKGIPEFNEYNLFCLDCKEQYVINLED